MKNIMFARCFLAIMLMLTAGAVTGCGDKEQDRSKTEKVTGEDVREKTIEAYDTARTYTQEQMKAFH